jgi:hypothetical protein
LARKKSPKLKTSISDLKEQDFLLENPTEAAQHLDAILYFIHKRYTDSNSGNVPDLGTFLITRADVVFSDQVAHVVIEKRPDRRVLQILTPPVSASEEEARRIFLLNEFGDLIIKCQKQAYLQIRDMLLKVTDPEGRETLIQEFEAYKTTLASKLERSVP